MRETIKTRIPYLLYFLLFSMGTHTLSAQTSSISTWHVEGGLFLTDDPTTDYYTLDTDLLDTEAANNATTYIMGTHPTVWGFAVNRITDDTTDFEVVVTAYDVQNGGAISGMERDCAMAFNDDGSMDFTSAFAPDLINNMTIQVNFFEYESRTNAAFSAGSGGTVKRRNIGISAPNDPHGVGRLISTELYSVDNVNSPAPLVYYLKDSCNQLDPSTVGVDTIRFLNEDIDLNWMDSTENASSYPYDMSADRVFFHTMEVENICDGNSDDRLQPSESEYDILFGAISSVSITRKDIKRISNYKSGLKSSIGFYVDSLTFLRALTAFNTDEDNDGIDDVAESGGNDPDGDEDGDGILNYLDTSDDGAGDGSTTDYTDSNSDGIPDVFDTDGDGIPNHHDLDADNDGIADIIEAGGIDTDGNGVVDNVNPDGTLINDTDGDGLDDAYDANNNGTAIANLDSDGDGLTDAYDLDADNDGIPDLVEAGGVDSNGDGLVDSFTDADDDGFADHFDPDDDGTFGIDAGEDGQPLVETDGSGNPKNGETDATLDADGDGIPDFKDLDADNDGIPDLVEAGGIDTDGNGRVDVLTDADNDGYADIFDTDDDGTPGIDDATDALLKTGGTDTDGDGKADDVAITFVDGDGNGLDHDGDGILDHLDLDADNDGIPDMVESGASDANNDGKVDTGLVPWDADGDGLADIYDESASDGPAGTGTNGTALIETTADTNADGKVNTTETMTAGGSNNINADTNGLPNHLDLDSDNDGITDVVENASGSIAADGSAGSLDGIIDSFTDADRDGWNDASNSTATDTDSDGVPDYADIDADNDGIPDYLEGVCTACPTAAAPSGNDSDGDGVLDIYASMSNDNTDNATGTNIGVSPNEDADDGTNPPDYIDTDTDEDTANDWTEGFDSNGDGNAIDDLITMAATYEANNTNPGDYTTTDTDNDDIPDWADNQPGTPGYLENTKPPYLVQGSGFWVDANDNGLADIFDAAMGGTLSPVPDLDNANDADWRDQATMAILPVELIDFTATEKNCKVTLAWTSASEERFSHYELERSANGSHFERLAYVPSRGGADEQAYNFTDASPLKDNYYRLKMVDLDGTFEYSKVITSAVNCKENYTMQLYPNPLQKGENINLKMYTDEEDASFEILDVTGKVVKTTSLKTNAGWNTLEIDVTDLVKGTYFLVNSSDVGISAIKFIKM